MQDPEPWTLRRPEPRKPEPPAPEPVQHKQLAMFDTGKNDLPGQKYMFDEFDHE